MKYSKCCIFVLRRFAIILITWSRSHRGEANCRRRLFSLTFQIMQGKPLLSSSHGPRQHPPHVCILAQLERLKAEIAKSKDEIIAGVKSDLDERRLGSQSYFDKEELIAKMAEFHVGMMRKVEVVGHKSSTAIQAGC